MDLRQILLLSILTVFVAGFQDSGAAERILYYTLYEIDKAINGGVAKTWATGCKNCNTLADFVKFIEQSGRRPNIPSGSSILETERLLEKQRFVGAYSFSDLNPNGKATISSLFRSIKAFLRTELPKLNDTALQQKLQRSLALVINRRIAGSDWHLEDHLANSKNQWKVGKTAASEVFPGASSEKVSTPPYTLNPMKPPHGDTIQLVDKATTIANTNKPNLNGAAYDADYKSWQGQRSTAGHLVIIKSLKDTQKLPGCK